jgi:hypothetical protein
MADQNERLQHSYEEQKKSNASLADEQERLELERRKATRSLGQACTYLYNLTRSGELKQLDDLIKFVSDSLPFMLQKQGAITATFLTCHGDVTLGLPAANAVGDAEVACSMRARAGDGPIAREWVIDARSPDFTVVPRFFSQEAPWSNGLVVRDTSVPDIADLLVLRMPGTEDKAGSLLRMPVLFESRPLGILCLDSEKVGALDRRTYTEIVEPFAVTLAAGFAIYAKSQNGERGGSYG